MEQKNRRRITGIAAAYLVMMAYLLFFREAQRTSLPYLEQLKAHFNPVPLRTIGLYLRLLTNPSRPWLIRLAQANLLGNVFLFIPLGLFPPLLCKKMQRLWKTGLFAAGVMTVVELLQMLLLVGTCDIDDLILNVLGACLGYGLFRLMYHEKETPAK